jgi:hypothetical protein
MHGQVEFVTQQTARKFTAHVTKTNEADFHPVCILI